MTLGVFLIPYDVSLTFNGSSFSPKKEEEREVNNVLLLNKSRNRPTEKRLEHFWTLEVINVYNQSHRVTFVILTSSRVIFVNKNRDVFSPKSIRIKHSPKPNLRTNQRFQALNFEAKIEQVPLSLSLVVVYNFVCYFYAQT